MSSVLLAACDKGTDADEPAATTAATTTAETEGDGGASKPAANPVEVDNVNGKNAAELFEAAMDEFSYSDTYEVEVKQTFFDPTTEEYGVTYKIKLGDERVYVYIDRDNYVTEYWVVDNVMYGESDEGKTKAAIESIDDCYVMDIVGDMMREFFGYIEIDVYLAELADVKLYSYRGEYYYERALTEDEADAFDLDVATAKETVYFNAQGDFIKRVFKDSSCEITMDIKSYGEPVIVNPPADPNSFIEVDLGGGGNGGGAGDVDSELYVTYSKLFDALEEAECYYMTVDMDDETIFNYATDGEGEYGVIFDDDGGRYYVWHIDGKGYIRYNDEETLETEVNEDFISTFDNIKLMRQAAIDLRLPKSEIDSISIVEERDQSTVISVVEDFGQGIKYQYTITFVNDYSFIYIHMAYVYDGEISMRMGYGFDYIDAYDFQLPLPGIV